MRSSNSRLAGVALFSLFACFASVGCKARPAADSGFLSESQRLAEDREHYPFHRVWFASGWNDSRYQTVHIAAVNTMYLEEPSAWAKATLKGRSIEEDAQNLARDGWLSDMMQSLPDIERLANRYRELCAEEGRKATVCIMRNAWVAPTLETLAEEWGDAAYRFFKGYWEAGARGRDQGDVFQRLAAGEHVSAAALSHDRAIAGTPEICIEQIQRWYEKTRFDYLYLGFTERRNYQALKRSIELFAREVMPAFK